MSFFFDHLLYIVQCVDANFEAIDWECVGFKKLIILSVVFLLVEYHFLRFRSLIACYQDPLLSCMLVLDFLQNGHRTLLSIGQLFLGDAICL